MSTKFQIFGPFVIRSEESINKEKILDVKDTEQFITEDLKKEGLSNKKGCYIFAMKDDKGYKPWYVGKSINQKVIFDSLTSDKITKYQNVVLQNSGTPVLFYVISDRFDPFAIDELEKYLIYFAGEKNSDLLNVQHMNRSFRIKGFHYGKTVGSSSELKYALGIQKKEVFVNPRVY